MLDHEPAADLRRNDPVDEETERVARELCVSLERDPDALVDGEPQWRQYVEMAVNAIASWRVLRS